MERLRAEAAALDEYAEYRRWAAGGSRGRARLLRRGGRVGSGGLAGWNWAGQ